MRSKLAKAVRARFDEQMRNLLPRFERDSTASVPPGWRAYRWQARPNLSCYVVLGLDTQHDNFTVECAWSGNGRFPAKVGLMFPRDIERSQIRRDEPRDGSYRFRLAYLWQDADWWWKLVPQADVNARMERFIDAVISHDLPNVMHSTEDPPIQEARSKVRPMVDDAVRKIAMYAVPYFEQVDPSIH